ncbi:MAG: hypothetical protein ACPG3T_03945, partial [Pseudomonadales bacterium]
QTQPGEILVAQSTLDHCTLNLETGRNLKLQPKGVKETISVTAINGINDQSSRDDNTSNDKLNRNKDEDKSATKNHKANL